MPPMRSLFHLLIPALNKLFNTFPLGDCFEYRKTSYSLFRVFLAIRLREDSGQQISQMGYLQSRFPPISLSQVSVGFYFFVFISGCWRMSVAW